MLRNTDKPIKQYDYFEKVVTGAKEGNPFTDYSIEGVFTCKDKEIKVKGFYDGDGKYIVRFMPLEEGSYTYRISGTYSDKITEGSFDVKKHDKNNHGPVKAVGHHFTYADNTPYYSVGTTCYVWELQSDEEIEKTLASLKKSGFNKIRFCIFPKHYCWNLGEPRSYPYKGVPMNSSVLTRDNFWDYAGKSEGNNWLFDRFNVEHFRHIENCIKRLGDLGVEADLIIYHPYDRWGFSSMTREQDTLYMEYVINRFSAFHNVWWAMANEYDFMPAKTLEDWEYYGNFFMDNDPYNHLRSIHNGVKVYDHSAPWVTHISYQRTDLYKTAEDTDGLRDTFDKPVVLDEIAYEGNIPYAWGSITGEEMVRRFWEGFLRGGYPGHGETLVSSKEDSVLWWAHGGKLKGESWKRVKFLLKIMSETPGLGLKKSVGEWDELVAVPEDEKLAVATGYSIRYYGFNRHLWREFHLDGLDEYDVEVIDTWNMTIKKVGTFSGSFDILLPGKPYMAIRMRKHLGKK